MPLDSLARCHSKSASTPAGVAHPERCFKSQHHHADSSILVAARPHLLTRQSPRGAVSPSFAVSDALGVPAMLPDDSRRSRRRRRSSSRSSERRGEAGMDDEPAGSGVPAREGEPAGSRPAGSGVPAVSPSLTAFALRRGVGVVDDADALEAQQPQHVLHARSPVDDSSARVSASAGGAASTLVCWDAGTAGGGDDDEDEASPAGVMARSVCCSHAIWACK